MTQVIVCRLVAMSPTATWQLTRPCSLVNRAFLRRAWGVAWSLGVVGVVEWALWTISAPKFRVRKDREGGVTHNTSSCPTDSCRNEPIPLESAGVRRNGTGIRRNGQESTGMELEWTGMD